MNTALLITATAAAVWFIMSAPRKPKPKPKVWNWPDYYSRGLIEKQWEPVEHFHGEWVVRDDRENGGRE